MARHSYLHRAALGAAALALAGCATRSGDVKPAADVGPLDPDWRCEQLFEESDRVQQRAADVAYAVDARVGNNMIALGLGVTVFWPALLAMRPDGLEAEELARLKGRYEAVQAALRRQGCGQPPVDMSPKRAAALPVSVGDRLVYDDRVGGALAPRELGLRVAALRRDQIEFAVDVAGQPQPGLWRQDLAGNPTPESNAPLLAWKRLLRRELALGQTVSGDLHAPGDDGLPAHVRGQVVARGPQTLAGRQFDVLVIELFGEAPTRNGLSTRLDGVMAVDGTSGVLLRLELRCANPDYALRRRLMRVESRAPAAG